MAKLCRSEGTLSDYGDLPLIDPGRGIPKLPARGEVTGDDLRNDGDLLSPYGADGTNAPTVVAITLTKSRLPIAIDAASTTSCHNAGIVPEPRHL
jgi:hypothetical protein